MILGRASQPLPALLTTKNQGVGGCGKGGLEGCLAPLKCTTATVCLNLITAADYLLVAIASASMAVACVLSCTDSNVSNGISAVPDMPAAPPLSPVEVEKAAATIQTHFRKFQQKKQKNGN